MLSLKQNTLPEWHLKIACHCQVDPVKQSRRVNLPATPDPDSVFPLGNPYQEQPDRRNRRRTTHLHGVLGKHMRIWNKNVRTKELENPRTGEVQKI